MVLLIHKITGWFPQCQYATLMLYICTKAGKKKKKKNQIIRICYSTVTWIYIEMKNQSNTTRANFQSSNSLTFYHHLQVSFYLFHWLTLLGQTLLWGSRAPATLPPGITQNHQEQYWPWTHKTTVTQLGAPQTLPPERGDLRGQGTPFNTEDVLTQRM